MTYFLSARSLSRLELVHPALQKVVARAIQITKQDFSVHDGLRTTKEQQALYKRGASKIDGVRKKSKHQEQGDGYAHAVDLVPYIDGKLRWEWPPIYEIAAAVAHAAEEAGVRIRWGGTWSELRLGSPLAQKRRVAHYIAKRKKQGHSAFIDGPHFEVIT